jgi:hypothetical protein
MGNLISSVEYECELCGDKFQLLIQLYKHYENNCHVLNNHNNEDGRCEDISQLVKSLARIIVSDYKKQLEFINRKI